MTILESRSMSSNRLPVLAQRIREAYADAQDASKKAAELAIDAGKSLTEAKGLVRHGEWLQFLRQAGIPERTAQRYMAVAQSNLESDNVSDLGGVTSALRFLGLRRRACDALAAAKAEPSSCVPALENATELIGEMAELFLSGDAP
jgi:hypothetical protein